MKKDLKPRDETRAEYRESLLFSPNPRNFSAATVAARVYLTFRTRIEMADTEDEALEKARAVFTEFMQDTELSLSHREFKDYIAQLCVTAKRNGI